MFCFKNLPDEPRGYVYVSAARGPVVIFGALFASVAINEYARSVSDCDGKIFNGAIKASSILSSLGTVEGIINGLLSPFLGAFVDLTPYRKKTLLFSFILFLVLVVAQGVLFVPTKSDKLDPNEDINRNPNATLEELIYLQEPWWNSDIALMLLVISIVVQVVGYEMAALLTSSYSAELSSDHQTMTKYVSLAYTNLNAMQLALAVLVTGASFGLGLSEFEQGVVGAGMVLVVTLAWLVPGYPKLGDRREVSEEVNKSYCGLVHLRDLFVDVFKNYHQIAKCLVSWACASASLSSITILATSYLQFHLGYKGVTVSALLAFALVFSVPGSLITSYLVKRYNLKVVYCAILAIFGLSFVVAPFLLISEDDDLNGANSTITFTQYGNCNATNGENDEAAKKAPSWVLYATGVFTMIWGLGIGSSYVANNAFYATLIPGARESSFFGVKVTVSKTLTWIPPLVYTVINEKTDYVQYAILILAPFFFLAAIIGWTIDQEKGVEDIKHTLHLRRGEGFHAGEVAAPSKGGKVGAEEML